MPSFDKVNAPQKTGNNSLNGNETGQIPSEDYKAIIQRVRMQPQTFSQADAVTLQRTIGNRAVGRLVREMGLINNHPGPGQFETCPGGKPPEEVKPLQMKGENRTGLPDYLKDGVENLSGLSMDQVRVHYNSDEPGRVGAFAYTQGRDIHVAPGQERHLPHEAWHVVQQARGRVQPTMQMQGVKLNDDAGLEREADEMGRQAGSGGIPGSIVQPAAVDGRPSHPPDILQRNKKKWTPQQRLQSEKFWEKKARKEKGRRELEAVEKEKKDLDSSWEAPAFPVFFAAQRGIQDRIKTRVKGGAAEEEKLGYSTVGAEFEMLGVPESSPLAHTAHIIVGEGEAMPARPAAKSLLETDSDNVIEFVTPVFMYRGNAPKGPGEHVKALRKLLIGFRNSLDDVTDFQTLQGKMGFCSMKLLPRVRITPGMIDEETRVTEEMRRGRISLAETEEVSTSIRETKKHKDWDDEPGLERSMQATVMVPLGLAAAVYRSSYKNKVNDSFESLQSKQWKPGVSLSEFLQIRSEEKKLADVIDLLGVRIEQILAHPFAVAYQKHYQKQLFTGADTQIAEGDKSVPSPERYREETAEYAGTRDDSQYQTDSAGRVLNYHVAHSSMKDESDVWPRVFLADVLRTVRMLDSGDLYFRAMLDAIEDRVNRSDLPQAVKARFAGLLKGNHAKEYTPPKAEFLEDSRGAVDLRQDTLRKAVMVNGELYVQMELRDLTDKTLERFTETSTQYQSESAQSQAAPAQFEACSSSRCTMRTPAQQSGQSQEDPERPEDEWV